jgi:hypothetical protein
MRNEYLTPSLNKTSQRCLDRVQKVVMYCIFCQPHDDGEYLWILGKKVNLNDIFEDLLVPERYKKEIADRLQCPNCGRSNFEQYEDVGLKDPYDQQIEECIESAKKKYGRKILALQKQFEIYPSLGSTDPVGNKIIKEIKKGGYPICDVYGIWYRAKCLKDEADIKRINFDAPPPGKPKEGRYNHSGQSVLYLSKDRDTAITEALEDRYESKTVCICVQEYQVDKVDRILDAKFNWARISDIKSEIIIAILHSRILEQAVENRGVNLKPQYYITRFIADCARREGLNGIRYSSTREFGENVVLFNPERVNKRPNKEKEIIRFQQLFIKNKKNLNKHGTL